MLAMEKEFYFDKGCGIYWEEISDGIKRCFSEQFQIPKLHIEAHSLDTVVHQISYRGSIEY